MFCVKQLMHGKRCSYRLTYLFLTLNLMFLITTTLLSAHICSSSHQLTSFLASMSAPAFTNVLSTSLCPFSAAKCSGVNCRYKIELLKAMDVTYVHIQSSIKLHTYVHTHI